jgi:ABC-type transport system involved in multi-copper enzyme maturation permease subunit
MSSFAGMLWVESRKALRSRMPLWTTLGSLFMPVGITLLIFLAKHPELTQQLGLVGAKANLLTYSATDWSSYLALLGEVVSAGGFFFFIITISWVFGREFVDGTLKDMLAIPVKRASILLAKFTVVIIWSAATGLIMLVFGILMGFVLHLPAGAGNILLNGIITILVTICLAILVVLPFAFFASLGRGYILPMAIAVLTLITANLLMVVGLAVYFPWAIPLLYSQGDTSLSTLSYVILVVTCLIGMFATYLWWKYSDQNR